jgi:uncharacterized protein YyaL (SSP411 family)
MKFSSPAAFWRLALALGGVFCFTLPMAAQDADDKKAAETFSRWGREALDQIDKDLWIRERRLYAEKVVKQEPPSGPAGEEPSEGTGADEAAKKIESGLEDPVQPEKKPLPSRPRWRNVAFNWSCGVQLSALAAAAKVDPGAYLAKAELYANTFQVYWNNAGPVPGYDVLPSPKDADRYYDDNAWIALAMVEIYEISKQPRYLRYAEDALVYVLSGEDDKLGGGIYWREKEKTSKNTCSNGPSITAALRVYQYTKNSAYRAAAERAYKWTNETLQDEDGLFWDNIDLERKINRAKLSYNAALMIRANCEFFKVTGDDKYLKEAQRIAKKGMEQWVQDNGGIRDEGRFAHLFTGSLLELYHLDKKSVWRKTVEKSLRYVYENLRDANGHYGRRWHRPIRGPVEECELLEMASPARAYWELAASYLEQR